MKFKIIPGINIQQPWSELLLSGKKVVETRSYRLPDKYKNQPLAVIETPGKKKLFKARIIGIITFVDSIEYKDEKSWKKDYKRHLVDPLDPQFSFDPTKRKFGWVVGSYCLLDEYLPPPKSRGIIFASKCRVSEDVLENLK